MNLKSGVVLVTLLALVLGTVSVSGAPGVSGPDILAQVDATMHSSSKKMQEKMTLTSASGQERVRKLQVQNKRDGAKDQMLVQFLYPADVKGSGVLISGDDMWLYLPALGKVRRIAGHAKKGSFMGSDLSYEDMEALGSSGFGQDYTAEYRREENCAGEATYVLELTPKTKEVSYQKLVMWVSTTTYLPRQIEYYSQDGKLGKRLQNRDITKIDGRWVAGTVEMVDLIKGGKTILEVENVDFDAAIDSSVFTTRYLERGV